MLSTAAALATLTTVACVIVYKKLPRKVRKIIEKHSLLTDLFVLLFTYMFLGGTITALIAAGIVSIIVSGLLEIANHPNQYLYIYDFCNIVQDKLSQVKISLNEYGEQYRLKKLEEMSNADNV